MPRPFVSSDARAPLGPRRKPTQQRSHQITRAILEAARRILTRDGAAAVTTTRVAQVAGVSVGSLYRYFPNRSAILRAVLAEHLGTIAEAVRMAAGNAGGMPPRDGVSHVVHAFLDAKLSEWPVSVAFREVMGEIEGHAVVGATLAGTIEALAPLVRAYTGNRDDGEVRLTAFVAASALDGAVSAALDRGASLAAAPGFRSKLERLVLALL